MCQTKLLKQREWRQIREFFDLVVRHHKLPGRIYEN